MKLKLSVNLDRMRTEHCRIVDTLAENARGKFITLGPGQSMVYSEKEKEAERISADPDVNPSTVPHIAKEAERYGVTLLDAATAVLIKAHEWRTVSPSIEDKRLSSKEAILASASVSEIERITSEAAIFYGAL